LRRCIYGSRNWGGVSEVNEAMQMGEEIWAVDALTGSSGYPVASEGRARDGDRGWGSFVPCSGRGRGFGEGFFSLFFPFYFFGHKKGFHVVLGGGRPG
jgi:hypothetical protein